MDETPCYFDQASQTTVAPIGSKSVSISTSGYEKLRFTTVLSCAASGVKHKPMIIFKNLKNVPTLKKGESWPTGKYLCYTSLFLGRILHDM